MLRFWKWASVFIGALFGERGGMFLSYSLQEKVKISFSQENFMRNSRDVLKKVLKMGNSLHKGHDWGM